MRDLALATAVAVLAAVGGWIWQASRQVPPTAPGSIRGGDPIGIPDGAGSPPRIGVYTPPPQGRGSGPRGVRGKSDHEVVTVAAPKRIGRVGGGYVVNIPYLAQFPPFVIEEGSAEARPSPLPASISELDGSEVEIQGFMIALTVEGGRAVQFLLSRYSYDDCCLGKTPEPNEYVLVQVDPAHAIPPVAEGTVIASGKFFASWQFNEAGEPASLYRMQAVRVAPVR